MSHPPLSPPRPGPAWFCLRTQPKHEHIAAGHLSRHEHLEILNPRIRFRRSTRKGIVWVTEPLFPCYLFARFDLDHSLARVQYAPGVSRVVHFGTLWPVVPDSVIGELRAALGRTEVHVIAAEPRVGEEIRIGEGAFQGLEAVILQVMPARERVKVLLDFLGRQTMVELDLRAVIRSRGHPLS